MVKFDARRAGPRYVSESIADPVSGEKIQVDITSPGPRSSRSTSARSRWAMPSCSSANGPVRDMVPYGQAAAGAAADQGRQGQAGERGQASRADRLRHQSVGGVREWCSNAAILLTALDELYQVYEQRPEGTAGAKSRGDQHSVHRPREISDAARRRPRTTSRSSASSAGSIVWRTWASGRLPHPDRKQPHSNPHTHRRRRTRSRLMPRRWRQ